MSNAENTCRVALDGAHRWREPGRAYPVDQLQFGFAQCTACGAVRWANGHIDRNLDSPTRGGVA